MNAAAMRAKWQPPYRAANLRRLALLIGAIGIALTAIGVWIPVKAMLAQLLIENAWQHRAPTGDAPRPWPWADTRPIAALRFDRLRRRLIVLAGDSGRVLAFGPGHRSGTAPPGTAGNSVISAHRDTHFSVLARLDIGDAITLETATGAELRYRVRERMIVDQAAPGITEDYGRAELTLVTCWPVDSIVPGGRERLVLIAEAEFAVPSPPAQPSLVGASTASSESSSSP